MPLLADCITVSGRFARSANVERDAGHAEPLDGYIVTARALDVVERIAKGCGSSSSAAQPVFAAAPGEIARQILDDYYDSEPATSAARRNVQRSGT